MSNRNGYNFDDLGGDEFGFDDDRAATGAGNSSRGGEAARKRQPSQQPQRGGSQQDDQSSVGLSKVQAITLSPSAGMPSDGLNAGKSNPGCENASALSPDIMLTATIAVLVPLLVIKGSEAIWPATSCANVDPTQLEKCESDAISKGNWHYMFAVVFGVLSLFLSLVLIKFNSTSRAAALGVAYGGLFTLLYAVITNQHKFTPLIQAFIVGALLALLLFLPRITHGTLFAYSSSKKE